MRRFPLAIALGVLFLALARPGSAATSADTCNFIHPIGWWATFDPPQPCAGRPVSLVVHDCGDCDHIVGFGRADDGTIYLEFVAPQVCPLTIVCNPESLLVPLGVFPAGQRSIHVVSHARVISNPIDSLGCDVYQENTVPMNVDSCPPVPVPTLPFVTQLDVEPTPSSGHSTICPGESISVHVHMVFPDLCFQFKGIELVPLAGIPELPSPVPSVRILVEACRECPCAQVLHETDARVDMPGLPAGTYPLRVLEDWIDNRTGAMDSTFDVIRLFSVDACSTSVFPCFLDGFEHQPGACDAVVSPDHPAVATMTVRTSAPIAGLQGILTTWPQGLAITGLEPTGPAATWKVATQPVPEGLKFVMLSTDGSVIPKSIPNGGYLSVLHVTLSVNGTAVPAPVTYLSVNPLTASDPGGQWVPPCPVMRIPNFAARICYGALGCDVNHDGVADLRDLVLMVHCVIAPGSCSDSSLDCNHDGALTIDDVLCCAGEILRSPMADTTLRRPEAGVQVSLGAAVRTASGVDIPVQVSGADRLGAARLSLRFPSDRFSFGSVDAAAPSWLAIGQADGSDLILGLIGLGSTGPSSVRATIHLTLRSGQSPGGELRLLSGDFSGPDGAALEVPLAPAVLPMDGIPRLLIAAPQPNPFSRETRFSVTLPGSAASLEVTIHDLAGRRIATVWGGGVTPAMIVAGTLPLRWAGTDDSGARARDGVYFVHVRANGAEVTKKIILLRGN